ncbi:MAG: histidine--tRNA ligase [Parcubacteria bacterium C7867-005]|nr:MAG: histidine--tRNA ligase [Parcubacteria bacterium C7867-005]
MSKLDTSPYKGVRDFYPEDQFIQSYIFDTWRKSVENFGYEEYEASVLEPSEIYKEKSGEEIVNEQTFTFKDRGGREVTLRPEMTPTVARMVAARRRQLGFPLRWYSIPNLFRYEATQRGRLREHWQLNVDLFGVSGYEADVELIVLADKILKKFGAKENDYEIRLNATGAITLEMLGDFIEKELKPRGVANALIDEKLARGQAYYNGIVFEFFDTNPQNPRSILGGGRYDNLTELFGESNIPVVGFGAGDVTIKDFLETHKLLPIYNPKTEIYVIPAPESEKSIEEISSIVESIRNSNVNVAIDWSYKTIGDQKKNALKLKIPFLLVIRENHIRSGIFEIENLITGVKKEVSLEEIPGCVK